MGGPKLSTPAQPAPRDVGKEYRDTLEAQIDLAPDLFESEAQFRPQYAGLDLDIMENVLLGSDRTQRTRIGTRQVPITEEQEVFGEEQWFDAYDQRYLDSVADAGLIRQAEQETTQKGGGSGRFEKKAPSEWKTIVTGYEDEPIYKEEVIGKEDDGILNLYENELLPFASRTSKTQAADQREIQSFQRGGDVADVEKYGKRAVAAFEAANPKLKRLTDLMGNQAADELLLGGDMSPEEMRNVEQATRGAFADRGMLYSNPAIFAEAMNRDVFSNQRKRERQQYAGQVADLLKRTGTDPFLAVVGRPAAQANTAGVAQGAFGDAGFSLNSTNRLMGPTQEQANAWAQDVYDSNYNAAWNNYIAGQNAAAASSGNNWFSPVFGGLATIGAALI